MTFNVGQPASWTADDDYVLVHAVAYVDCIITTKEEFDYAAFLAALPTPGSTDFFYLFLNGGYYSNRAQDLMLLDYEIPKGTSIFASGQYNSSLVQLYLQLKSAIPPQLLT